MQIADDGSTENKNSFGGVLIKCKNKVLLCKRREDILDTAFELLECSIGMLNHTKKSKKQIFVKL